MLTGFDLDPLTLASSVLGFNLGIEAFQLLVIAAVMPALVLLARSRVYGPFRIGGAAVTGVAAAAWFAERASGWGNPVGPVVEVVASQGFLSLIGLNILAFIVTDAESVVHARETGRSLISAAPQTAER
jgi:RsiW-degrading membrane proteinase PrsW (M82 family)